MLDPQNELYDRRLARHLVSLYFQSHDEEEGELMVCEWARSNSGSMSMLVAIPALHYRDYGAYILLISSEFLTSFNLSLSSANAK
jgi:hypothetical protein